MDILYIALTTLVLFVLMVLKSRTWLSVFAMNSMLVFYMTIVVLFAFAFFVSIGGWYIVWHL